jgi:catechol 2,3-dioxygenase-like lactoylglutathione lyase family enzyme
VSREDRLAYAEEHGIRTQLAFEDVINEAAGIRVVKVRTYGERRHDPSNSFQFDMLMSFSDIYRKFIRLENMMLAGETIDPDTGESLRDTLLDLSNYAAEAVIHLDRHVPVKPTVTPGIYPIEQIAIACPDPEQTKRVLAAVLGCDEWHEDQVTTEGFVFGSRVDPATTATLNFNYQLIPGKEFELLTYHDERNWLSNQPEGPQTTGMSHLGLHVPDVDDVKRRMETFGYKVAQEFATTSHTNPNIAGKRQYRYVIFDTRAAFGFDLKVIQRINLQ